MIVFFVSFAYVLRYKTRLSYISYEIAFTYFILDVFQYKQENMYRPLQCN